MTDRLKKLLELDAWVQAVMVKPVPSRRWMRKYQMRGRWRQLTYSAGQRRRLVEILYEHEVEYARTPWSPEGLA